MTGKMKSLFLFTSLVLFFLFIIFVINQTVQIVDLCRSLNPVFGTIVQYFLIAVYFLLVFGTVYSFARLPKPLKFPWGKDSPRYREFLLRIRSRMVKNKDLPGHLLNGNLDVNSPGITLSDLEKEIRLGEKELDKRANQEIKTTAQAIFISTAISQSGSLDGIVVLVGQVKMVWRIARIYNQRPSLRELVKLYANVAATSFAARAIEELDFAEIIEPVIKNFSSSGLLNLIPVISILSNSLFSGTTNALLTLRTGIITQQYCSLFSHFEAREKYGDGRALKKHIRLAAIREAGKILGSVIVTPSQTVMNIVLNTLKKGKDASGKMAEDIMRITKEFVGRVADLFRKKGPAGEDSNS